MSPLIHIFEFYKIQKAKRRNITQNLAVDSELWSQIVLELEAMGVKIPDGAKYMIIKYEFEPVICVHLNEDINAKRIKFIYT